MTGLEKLGQMQNQTTARIAMPYLKQICENLGHVSFYNRFVTASKENKGIAAKSLVMFIKSELGKENAVVIAKFLTIYLGSKTVTIPNFETGAGKNDKPKTKRIDLVEYAQK